ncbi:MAG: cysteine hydrolase family protein [Nitrososphaerales archaeon]
MSLEAEVTWSFEELVQPEHSAVIVVDMQNDFCSDKGAHAKMGMPRNLVKDMAPRLGRFLSAARKSGITIIHTQNIHSEWTLSSAWRRSRNRGIDVTIQGTWGAEWFEEQEELTPRKNEYVVQKHRYSAFIGTDLEMILKAKGIRTLIMTGTGTNACVESTARHGSMLDFHIVFLADCTATVSQQAHEGTLRNIESLFGTVANSDQLMKSWSSS